MAILHVQVYFHASRAYLLSTSSSHFGTCQFVLPSPPPVNPLTPTTPELTVNLQLQLDWAMAASFSQVWSTVPREPHHILSLLHFCQRVPSCCPAPHSCYGSFIHSKTRSSAWAVEQTRAIKDHIINPMDLSSFIIWIWKYSAPAHNHTLTTVKSIGNNCFNLLLRNIEFKNSKIFTITKRIMKTMQKTSSFYQ